MVRMAALCAAIAGTAGPSWAQMEHRQLEAHVHGVGKISFVAEGDALVVELETPLANLVGFEHAPATDAERRAYDDAITWLSGPASVFDVSRARCETAGVNMEQPAFADLAADGHEHEPDGHDHAAHDHDGHDHDAAGHGHSELRVEYRLQCAALDQLARIEVGLFGQYPGFQELEAVYVGEVTVADTLMPAHSVLDLR